MFDAEYIHRHGTLHGNVDFLSRPPIDKVDLELEHINSIRSVFENSNPNNKYLDICEDDELQYFLKHGKHLSGLSSKRLKRVLKMTNQ